MANWISWTNDKPEKAKVFLCWSRSMCYIKSLFHFIEMRRSKQVRQTEKKKKILLVSEALAVPLAAISLHKTTWLTIYNVKVVGCGSYATMERWCMMDGNTPQRLNAVSRPCRQRLEFHLPHRLTILFFVPLGAIGYIQYEVKFCLCCPSSASQE